VVEAAGLAERVTVQSFDWRTLAIVKRLEPRIEASYLTAAPYQRPDSPWTAGHQLHRHGSLARMVRAAAGAADATWSPDYRDLTQPMVEEARALQLKVLPWTVNDPPDMERLIDWRVGGFITDYPDRARDVLRARGIALPCPAPPSGR
jgi:glycerophosphoryl diester phosphodiesterase